MATSTRKRYEILVRTRMSPASLARLRIALTPTTVPGNTVHRLRVPGDRDISEVLRTLIERNIQLLEVRRCAEPIRSAVGEPPGGAVIVPFPASRGAISPPAPRAPLPTGDGAAVLPLGRRRR
jgi:hypothetical protein